MSAIRWPYGEVGGTIASAIMNVWVELELANVDRRYTAAQ